MDGISSTNADQTSMVDTAIEGEQVAVCNEHADTIIESLQIQKDGLIEDMRKIQLEIDKLNRQLAEIDAKYDPREAAIRGAISTTPATSIVGAVGGFVGALAQEAVEMAPVREAIQERLDSLGDKLWGLDYVGAKIKEQIDSSCDK